jgi:hypothetical protein
MQQNPERVREGVPNCGESHHLTRGYPRVSYAQFVLAQFG